MAKFVQNPAGGVHSVPDDFAFPLDANGQPVAGWSFVTGKDATPALLGKAPDPAVAAVEAHNGGPVPPEVVSNDPNILTVVDK